ncbi:MAG: NAD-dependent epimerase/dehydratase family protein [Bacteroidales bacterium]|nr:NAD-dependent epimerase/dehydratase family protein [Bacteroidales bacterium]MCF6342801.1 NAD-dependent epimerase/dehydratase family protein [Bacteroidales bacterium]
MKKTLVTGGTGLAGYNIILALLKRKRKVKALVRSIEKGQRLLPGEVELVAGDITNKESVRQALKGCDRIYHAAGYPEQWLKDPAIFERVNVEGTQNVLDAAIESGIEKMIYTSTIDVFEAKEGELFDESHIDPNPKGTHYERSKQEADRRAVKALQKGLPLVIVHPAAIYGPGPASSPGINNFAVDLKNGKLPMLLPGGLPLVFSEDVGEGHVLAEEKGNAGQRFILSEGFYQLPALAAHLFKVLNISKKVPVVMPLPIVKMVSETGEYLSKFTSKPPLIPRGQLHFLLWGAIPDSRKAQKVLGWKPTPLPEGLVKTVGYLFS